MSEERTPNASQVSSDLARFVGKKDFNCAHQYYYLSLSANDNGPIWSVHSQFIGFADDKARVEIREASLVDPKNLLRDLDGIVPYVLIVDTMPELFFFLRLGGHAIICDEIAS